MSKKKKTTYLIITFLIITGAVALGILISGGGGSENTGLPGGPSDGDRCTGVVDDPHSCYSKICTVTGHCNAYKSTISDKYVCGCVPDTTPVEQTERCSGTSTTLDGCASRECSSGKCVGIYDTGLKVYNCQCDSTETSTCGGEVTNAYDCYSKVCAIAGTCLPYPNTYGVGYTCRCSTGEVN